MNARILKTVVVALLCLPFAAQADEATLSFQGGLTDLNDVPITGDRDVTFQLYERARGGDAIWRVEQTLDVIDGRFTAVLGTDEPLPAVGTETALYLGLQIAGEEEFTPRIRVGASLRAQFAAQAGDVAGRDIHPATVAIGQTPVIDEAGNWVGPNGIGESGAAGPAGARGAAGPAGEAGFVGPPGSPGGVGPVGIAGANGADGSAGGVGRAGPMGPAGPMGVQGNGGPQGAAGPQGQDGPRGPVGAIGSLAAGRWRVIENQGFNLPDQHLVTVPRTCPRGWQVVGGGSSHDSDAGALTRFGYDQSRPFEDNGRSGWLYGVYNYTGRAVDVHSWMICIDLR